MLVFLSGFGFVLTILMKIEPADGRNIYAGKDPVYIIFSLLLLLIFYIFVNGFVGQLLFLNFDKFIKIKLYKIEIESKRFLSL